MQSSLRHKNLVWRAVSDAFFGAVIEALHGQFDLLSGDGIEGHFLQKELANQPVHVLVGDAFMQGELTTVVSRQGMNAVSRVDVEIQGFNAPVAPIRWPSEMPGFSIFQPIPSLQERGEIRGVPISFNQRSN